MEAGSKGKNKGKKNKGIAEVHKAPKEATPTRSRSNSASDDDVVDAIPPPPADSPTPSPTTPHKPTIEKAKEMNNNEEDKKTKDPSSDLKLLGSREAERNLLILLNQRLEKVIERNRQLQRDNNQLLTQLEVEKEKCSAKVTEVTLKVNDELEKARQELTNAKKEVTVLSFKLGTARKEAEDAKTKADRSDAEVKRQKDKINQLEKRVDDLNAQIRKEADANEKLERVSKEWETEAMKQGQVLQEAKTELEKEILAKLDLEKALKGEIDEKVTKTTLVETEMLQLKASTNQLLHEQNEKQQKEFENLLEKNMKNLRDEYAKKLVENKEEQSFLYATKEKDHIKDKESLKGSLKNKEDQLDKIQKEVKSLTEAVRRLESERHALLVQLDDLEGEKKAEKAKLEAEVQNRDALIKDKTKEQNELLDKCQHLLDVKVALDNELAAYKTLLETEESRLQIGQFDKTQDENGNLVTPPTSKKTKEANNNNTVPQTTV